MAEACITHTHTVTEQVLIKSHDPIRLAHILLREKRKKKLIIFLCLKITKLCVSLLVNSLRIHFSF